MESKKSKSQREYQRQRKELMTHLRILLEEMEGRPAQPRSAAGFPFNVLEDIVTRMILSIESLVASLVSVSLGVLSKRRKRM